jgi:hypothetical protein
LPQTPLPQLAHHVVDHFFCAERGAAQETLLWTESSCVVRAPAVLGRLSDSVGRRLSNLAFKLGSMHIGLNYNYSQL